VFAFIFLISANIRMPTPLPRLLIFPPTVQSVYSWAYLEVFQVHKLINICCYSSLTIKKSMEQHPKVFPGYVPSNVPSKLRACAHTGCETSAHKKTWSAHKCSLQKCVLHIFHTRLTRHSIFRRVQVKCWTKEILCAHRL